MLVQLVIHISLVLPTNGAATCKPEPVAISWGRTTDWDKDVSWHQTDDGGAGLLAADNQLMMRHLQVHPSCSLTEQPNYCQGQRTAYQDCTVQV